MSTKWCCNDLLASFVYFLFSVPFFRRSQSGAVPRLPLRCWRQASGEASGSRSRSEVGGARKRSAPDAARRRHPSVMKRHRAQTEERCPRCQSPSQERGSFSELWLHGTKKKKKKNCMKCQCFYGAPIRKQFRGRPRDRWRYDASEAAGAHGEAQNCRRVYVPHFWTQPNAGEVDCWVILVKKGSAWMKLWQRSG